MNKYLKISEYIWLATSVISVGIVAYVLISEGFKGNLYILVLPVMAGVMWMMRRRQRMKLEQQNKEKE